MNCPVCGEEMHAGGVIALDCAEVRWLPQEEFARDTFERGESAGHPLGVFEYLNGGWRAREAVKINNAYFCGSCFKVCGTFDVSP